MSDDLGGRAAVNDAVTTDRKEDGVTAEVGKKQEDPESPRGNDDDARRRRPRPYCSRDRIKKAIFTEYEPVLLIKGKVSISFLVMYLVTFPLLMS